MTDPDKLAEAIAELRRVTPDNSPWETGDFGRGYSAIDEHIATILNAVASGELIPATERDAAVAAALEEAAAVIDTCGDSAVTEAMGQQLCCSGHHCGCQGADVGALLRHNILALINQPQAAALAPVEGAKA